MYVHEENKILQMYRTGNFQWNSSETKSFFGGSSSKFDFSVFECTLCASRYCLNNSENFTVFSLKDTTFPKWFSSFYTFSVIDSAGNERYTAKGRIRDKSVIILLTIFESQVLALGKDISLRISWFEREGCAVSEQAVQVDPGSIPVSEQSIQTEEPQLPPTRDICINTDVEAETLLEILSKDFGRFHEKRTGTDCVLKVGSVEFPVHRQVLSARSDVFEAMFRHDTSESLCGIVDIPDIEADVMSDILFYVYTGKIHYLSTDSAVPMCIAADKYALMGLKEKCIEFLLHNLTLENFCDAAVLAHTHGETELEKEVIIFIEERLKELMDNENWKNFLKNKSVLASRLLCSALMANKEKNEKMSV